MCGFVATTNLPDRRQHLPAALDAIAHRGPDARHVWSDDRCALGHLRLSIVALDAGRQPMSTPDGRYTLAYNGELYNTAELRHELEQRGVRFDSQSDTQVLLHALEQWGLDALPRLDAMFAFALWDRDTRTLLLARDRLGVKPLYFSHVTGDGQPGLIAGSEIGALRAFPGVGERVDLPRVSDYLAQGYFIAGRSFFAGIEQLPPGAWLRFHADTGRTERGQFWTIPPAADPMPLPDLIDAADAALQESVRRQLVADVPVGVLFSGGIDSALLTHYAQQATGQPAKTYTVKFDQSAAHDEAPIAARVAQQMGTQHHEFHAGGMTADDFRAACAQLDQPYGDASFLPVARCCELARRDITVALGGDGGDELFAGYPRYRKDAATYPDGPHWETLRRLIELGLLPASLYRSAQRGRSRITRQYSRMQDIPVTSRALRGVLSPDYLEACQPRHAMRDWQNLVDDCGDRWDRDALMRADVWNFLAGNGLTKTDRASMWQGMEARVPMLGNPVVDLILPQPASVKLAGGLKTVLKELARRHLPREAWDRPKRGFTVPVTQYLCHDWRDYTQTLIDRVDTLAPVLDEKEVRRRWGLHRRGHRVDWPIYPVMALLGWLDTHDVSW